MACEVKSQRTKKGFLNPPPLISGWLSEILCPLLERVPYGLLWSQQEAVGIAVAVGLVVAGDRSSRVDALRKNESCAGDFKGGDGTVGPTQESVRNALRVGVVADNPSSIIDGEWNGDT